MTKSFYVFVDEMYYNDFVALYNSWKYYEHKTPIKVFHHDLTEEHQKKINSVCELIKIEPKDNIPYSYYIGRQIFKYIALIDYMDDLGILLDADTIFLSNTDNLFNEIENGKFLGATEFDSPFNHIVYYENDDEFESDKKLLESFIEIEILESFKKDYTNIVFNGGFLGFSKKHHTHILQKTVDILSIVQNNMKNSIFHNEQFMINFLMDLYNIERYRLKQSEWMNTWWNHKTPKKIISIENGKFKVTDANENHLKFYHFTGDIGMPYGEKKELYTCRTHQLYGHHEREPAFNREDVEYLWYIRHESPLLLLYEFFHNKGL